MNIRTAIEEAEADPEKRRDAINLIRSMGPKGNQTDKSPAESFVEEALKNKKGK